MYSTEDINIDGEVVDTIIMYKKLVYGHYDGENYIYKQTPLEIIG